MAKIIDIKDIEIQELLMHIGYRSALIRGNIQSIPVEQQEAEIICLNDWIEHKLVQLDSSPNSLSKNTMQRILQEGYYLDIHKNPSKTKHPQNIYLGHINEKREVNLNGKNHLFLSCHSRQYECFGVSYPDFFQPKDLQVYTNDFVTWLDFKKPVKYVSPNDYPKYLEKLDLIALDQLRIKGEKNYQRFPNRGLLEPGEN